MSRHERLPAHEVEANRAAYLAALRSGKYRKGTTRSDDRGRPVVEGLAAALYDGEGDSPDD